MCNPSKIYPKSSSDWKKGHVLVTIQCNESMSNFSIRNICSRFSYIFTIYVMKYPSAGKGRGGIREKNSMGRNYVVSVFQIKRRKKQRAKQAATINVGCLEIPWFCYSFSNVSTLYVTFSFLYRGARTDSQYYIDMRCRIYNSPHLKNKLPFIFFMLYFTHTCRSDAGLFVRSFIRTFPY